MRKFLILVVAALMLAGCSDEQKAQDEKLQEQLSQAQQQIQQLQLQKQLADQQVTQLAQTAPAAQPVVVQAPAASHDSTLMNTMVGAAAGVAIGNMMANAGSSNREYGHTTVIKKVVYKKVPQYSRTKRSTLLFSRTSRPRFR